MKRKKIKLIVSIALFSFFTLSIILFFPQSVLPGVCEDYCYDWYFGCRAQGGSLSYCTDGMMDCLIDYCGWQQ